MAPAMPAPNSIAGAGAPAGSASAIVAHAESGYHVLRIEGYSCIKSTIPNCKQVESPTFRVAGHTWAIDYYPNGNLPETADYISLFLRLKDPVTDTVVQFWFTFADQVENQTPAYLSTVAVNRFTAGAKSYGQKKFIKREDLESSGRLSDDCFTIRCDMVVLGEPRGKHAAAAPSIVVPPPDWPQHFRALLLSEQGADVRFRVGEEVFAAHRCVLAARSPVFNAELFGAMKEGSTTTEDCIRIDDMLPQVFKTLLHFIYTDSLPEAECQGEADANMAQHLLEAADRYGMDRLKLICEDRLCRHIDVSTVATTLTLAEQHRCQGLKEACFEFLKSSKTLSAVMGTDGFQHLAKSCPLVLFELMSKLAER